MQRYEELIEEDLNNRDIISILLQANENQELVLLKCNRTYSDLTGIPVGLTSKDIGIFFKNDYLKSIFRLCRHAFSRNKEAVYEFIHQIDHAYWNVTAIIYAKMIYIVGKRIKEFNESDFQYLPASLIEKNFFMALRHSLVLDLRKGFLSVESCSDSLLSFLREFDNQSLTGICFDTLIKDHAPMVLSSQLLKKCLDRKKPIAMLDMYYHPKKQATICFMFYAVPMNYGSYSKLLLALLPLNKYRFLALHEKSVPQYELLLRDENLCMCVYKYKHGRKVLRTNLAFENMLDRNHLKMEIFLKLPFIKECRIKQRLVSGFQQLEEDSGESENYYYYAMPASEDSSMLILMIPEVNSDLVKKGKFERLTNREHEIIDLVLNGYTNKYIAKHLKLSEGTVKKTIYNAYKKMGIASRMELLKYNYEN